MRGSTGLFALEKDSATLSRFLNRLLGLPVRLQNQLFAYFTDTLASLIKKAKRAGSWDGGIRGTCTCTLYMTVCVHILTCTLYSTRIYMYIYMYIHIHMNVQVL